VLEGALGEPLQAPSIAVSITHDTVRMKMIDKFIATTRSTQ
jgi:hypothetical protein